LSCTVMRGSVRYCVVRKGMDDQMNKEKAKIYYKEYYRKNKDKYRKTNAKYRNSPSGFAAYARADEKFKANNPLYQKAYMKLRRLRAQQEGICVHCFRRPVEKDRTQCKECLIKSNESSKKYYKDNIRYNDK